MSQKDLNMSAMWMTTSGEDEAGGGGAGTQ